MYERAHAKKVARETQREGMKKLALRLGINKINKLTCRLVLTQLTKSVKYFIVQGK